MLARFPLTQDLSNPDKNEPLDREQTFLLKKIRLSIWKLFIRKYFVRIVLFGFWLFSDAGQRTEL